MVQEILQDLYCIKVALPNSPLKSLNSYVFTGNERNLLVDTGFNRPECLASLRAGIEALALDMGRTDILITHCHSDHSGLVGSIASPDSRIFMSAIDYKITADFIEHADKKWNELEKAYVAEGFPASEINSASTINPARMFAADTSFTCTPVMDKQVIKAGQRELQCILTPGHTPGHMCFYGAREKLMLTGDHVLFDITPNITVWRDLPNALASYLESLHKISAYQVSLPLAGHRESNGDFQHRIKQLLRHHEERLEDVMVIIAQGGAMHGYEVASKMKWDIKAKDWSDFPLAQKRFAVGEALAHINYLLARDRLKKIMESNINYYSPV